MKARTVPADEWVEFVNRFSKDHVGWPVTVEVLDPALGPHPVAQNLPLQGISFDMRGSRPGALEISAGNSSGRHVNHVVDLPLNIRHAEDADGSIHLQIEPATGPPTLIHLRGSVH